MTRCILCANERGTRIPSIRRAGLCGAHAQELSNQGRMLAADMRIQAIAQPPKVCHLCEPWRTDATQETCAPHLDMQRRMLHR